MYLAQNKLPSIKTMISKLETQAEKYVLLDSLLFKIVTQLAPAVSTQLGPPLRVTSSTCSCKCIAINVCAQLHCFVVYHWFV